MDTLSAQMRFYAQRWTRAIRFRWAPAGNPDPWAGVLAPNHTGRASISCPQVLVVVVGNVEEPPKGAFCSWLTLPRALET